MSCLLHDWERVTLQLPPWVIRERGYSPSEPGIDHTGKIGIHNSYHCKSCGKTRVKFRDGDCYIWDEGKKYER